MKFRTSLGLMCAAAVCASLCGCSGKAYKTHTIETSEGTLTLVPLADNAIRVRLTDAGSIDLREIIYTEKVKQPSFKVSEDDSQVVLKTSAITAVYDKAQGSLTFTDASGNVILSEVPGTRSLEETEVLGHHAYSVKQTFKSPADEYLFGTGQFQDGYLNVRGLTRRLTQVNTQIALPFVLSNKGYGILWNNYGRTDFNPADSCVTMNAEEPTGAGFTVNATGTSGNRREFRRNRNFNGTMNVTKAGQYAFLLDVGQKMGRKHYLAIDGKPVIDLANTWLPPTSSVLVDLEEGEHTLEVQGSFGDNPLVYWRQVTDETTFASPVAQAVDYTVFAGDADKVISSYRTLTGAVPQMPEWMFSYIHCRERYHSQDEILKTASEFKNRNIPLGTIVQDWQWWGKTGWNSMEFDPDNYPDPKALTDGLHDMGAHLMLSVWSKIDHPSKLGKRFEEKGYYIPETDWVDFINPEAASYYWQNFRDSLAAPYGIDVWWLDATEPENDDLDGRMVNGGTEPGAFYRNAYPSFVVKTVYEGMRHDVTNRPPVILTRSAFPGMQRYGAITWSGDVGNDYQTLHHQIVGGLGQMAAGLPWWTYDAGGFFRPNDQYTDPAYQERMLRWIQTSVFLPFMRVHGYMSNTEPWNYSDETYKIFVNCIKIREALKPYIVKVSKAVSKEGYTMMRPLVFDFPKDVEALRQDTEYMFGPSLLVCPVLEADATQWRVYLPDNGKGWVSLLDGRKYDGGQYVTVAVGPDMIPVFAVADKADEFSEVSAMMGNSLALAYGDDIVFDSVNWDFGKVDDNEGTVTHTYAFLNPSSRPFKLGPVNVSCSCISVDYPHEAIPAGGRGEIVLTFMPAGAAGAVYRTVDVYGEDGSSIATLSMHADVNRVDADLEDLYHITLSEQLLVDRGDVRFGYMYHGQTFSKLVRLANVSHETLNLRFVTEDPGSMLSVEGPSTIAPRSEEEILLTYRIPDDPDLFGVTTDEVLVFANGAQTGTPIHVSAIYMAPVQDSELNPSLWTKPSLVHMEKSGSSYVGKIEIGNSGNADLNVRELISPVEMSIRKGLVIKPGKTVKVKVKSADPTFSAFLFTDDPVRPYKELCFDK